MKLCSACLLGIECRYDGKSNIEKASQKLIEEYKKGNLIPVCPEQLGGLSIPRSGARILSGKGEDVLDGKSKLVTDDGKDVTQQYIKGAFETLKIAKDLKVEEVILKQKSPSCGSAFTQGGEKERVTVEGSGVTTVLLQRNGIKVVDEKSFI